MSFDFATVMVIAVVVTGVIWALDIKLWAPKRREAADALKSQRPDVSDEDLEKVQKEPILVEYARSFFPVILIVLLLRSFLVEPFRIPSGSMMPTLLVGDFILVNKYTYGLRLPVTNTKIVDFGEPQRGDVVVFRYPKDPSVDYIKRVIGVPGDRIAYRNKQLYVNGKKVPVEFLGTYTGENSGMPISGIKQFQETINGVEHDILLEDNRPRIDGEIIVPDGQYFVMGDNRDNSNDSRFWGTVPEENLVGRAFMIWMNWNSDQGGVMWSRLGQSIE